MSSHVLLAFVSLFLLLQPTISSDFLAPLLSPFLDELCKDVLCGKGKCKLSTDNTIGYMCDCDQGWKQTTSDEQKNLPFLPCVIPNCTLNSSCTKAPSPSPQVEDPPKNMSFFDPCKWAYCGGGSCMKESKFGHKCECQNGYANLLNNTVFPCMTECSLGMDCASLNLTLPNRNPSSTPVSNDNSDNHDELCKDVLCGKGKCKLSTDNTIGYMCDCDQGWKQTTSDEQKNLPFLPCVIPNCTLNSSCTKAQSPSPQVEDPPKNMSFFDPCKWAYCGGGSCMKESKFGHKCDCQKGYANLLNNTVFPCMTECSLGMDCASLNLTLPNRNPSSTPVSNDNSDNHASSILPGNILWLVTLMLTIGLILSK